jgi:hypothetical protein
MMNNETRSKRPRLRACDEMTTKKIPYLHMLALLISLVFAGD